MAEKKTEKNGAPMGPGTSNIKDPEVYEALRREGASEEKAARIANASARDGRDEGLLELDRREAPDVELAFFGLTSALVGQGAGRWLMARALDLAWRHRPRRFWVHTCTLDHPAALGFYRRSGFTPVERHIEMAQDPRLNGLLPRDCAPHIPIV